MLARGKHVQAWNAKHTWWFFPFSNVKLSQSLGRDCVFKITPLKVSKNLIRQLTSLDVALKKQATTLQALIRGGKTKNKHYTEAVQEAECSQRAGATLVLLASCFNVRLRRPSSEPKKRSSLQRH